MYNNNNNHFYLINLAKLIRITREEWGKKIIFFKVFFFFSFMIIWELKKKLIKNKKDAFAFSIL